MYLVLSLACVGVIVGVVAVAMGWGGELALFRRDLPEVPLRLRTPLDVALLRFPLRFLGYQEQATADALRAVARLLAERDSEIARLRDQVWRLGPPDDEAKQAGDGAAAGDADVLSRSPGTTGTGQAGGGSSRP